MALDALWRGPYSISRGRFYQRQTGMPGSAALWAIHWPMGADSMLDRTGLPPRFPAPEAV